MMADNTVVRHPVAFSCPACGARYQLARIEASAEPTRPLACISCGGPLPAREDEFFLKYFLIERPRTSRAVPLRAP
jgi:predicted RNA-binding Zn-ribbon protein involved in translation (DUF1610 family)